MTKSSCQNPTTIADTESQSMNRLPLVRSLVAGTLCLWVGPAHATTCNFGDFSLDIERVGDQLQVVGDGGSQVFRNWVAEPEFWSALSYSDHGKETSYLMVRGRLIVLTVHSVGQLLVSETFRSVCEASIQP